MRMRWPAAAAAAATMAVAGCAAGSADGSASGPGPVLVVVSAPASTEPWVAGFERNGAELAAREINQRGGATVGRTHRRVVVDVRDNAGSAATAAADARFAVAHHAAALLIDGVGAGAVADITKPASLPVFVVFDGAAAIIESKTRPTLFRMAPADKAMAGRLADYLANGRPRIALLSDDTSYGRDGATALADAFRRDGTPVVSRQTVPDQAADVSAQVLAAQRSGASTVVVWASAPVVAATVQSARTHDWTAPIWAGPTGEDPLVRQRLAAHPQWLQGVGFVSFRITSEVGPAPFAAYRRRYDAAFGEQRIGVVQGGKQVVQPPDWSMYPYDAVNLTVAALREAGSTGGPLLAALQHTVIVGANGDERGFSASNREGVSPDDMYFARFTGFTFAPVTNDILSTNLPSVPQTVG